MTEQFIDSETRIDRENGVYGRVVARDVSAEEFMAQHAAHFREWVEGTVIDVSPATFKHDEIVNYLREVLRSYFGNNRIGSVVGAPVVMQLDNAHSRREPDLQVILKSNPAQKTAAALIGPADICIEVVSQESVRRDYGDKFGEYQDAGVKEYWLIDPLRNTATFYRLNDDGVYMPQMHDANSSYQTPLLPKLSVYVPTLWEEELPDIYAVTDAVRAMMKKSDE